MQVRLLLSFCFLFIYSSTLAFVAVDSVRVENVDGKKVILHKVEAHETYYSIARKYDVSARSISDFYHTSVLKIGDIVKVQTDIPFERKTVSVASVKNPKVSSSTINYVVKSKETLYAVAKKFGMTVDEVKGLNKLNGDDLAVGKVLKVRSISTPNIKKTVETVRVQVPDQQVEDAQVADDAQNDDTVGSINSRLKHSSIKYGLHETTERGVALCINDENLDGSKMLALHRGAPIGTVIKITNPMTQKSTFAKVVGKFTESESTKNVTIVLTKAVADLVGALDKKFQVNLMYGVPNE